MSMFELTAIVWRRKLLVLGLAAALFVIGALTVVATRHTAYTATSQVLFDQPALDITPDGAAVPTKITNLLPTFCDFVSTEEVAIPAATAAGVSAGQAAAVQCTPEADTLIVLLQLKTGSASLAQNVVAAVSQQLVTAVEQRYDPPGTPGPESLTAQIIQPSLATRDSDKTLRSLGLVAVGALIVAAAFTLAAEPHRKDWLGLPATRELAAVRVPAE